MDITLDDRHEVFQIYSSLCGRCPLYEWGKYRCPAFPDGIPKELLSGDGQKCTDYDE